MSSTNFYQELPGFSDFRQVTDRAHYRAVPEDWTIFIADIRSSTQAIERGAYKEVNTVGAACIVAAHNAMQDIAFPYQFGGDGMTLLVPPSHSAPIQKELLAVRDLARDRYQLDLRVWRIPVAEILTTGLDISVAKFGLVQQKSMAFFRGGGLSLAEARAKNSGHAYLLEDGGAEQTNLSKLSCRWNPIPSKNGKILSLLVFARGKHPEKFYRHLIKKLENLYQGKLASANPVTVSNLGYQSIRQCIRYERGLYKSPWSLSFVKRLLNIIFAVILFRYKLPLPGLDTLRYVESMAQHSDYRKFDDMLRMTIDCDENKISQIESYLESAYTAGQVYYGLHQSDHALMTCFVDGLGEGEHIHFIDGGDGGYAIAAKALKQQMQPHNSATTLH